MPRPSKYKFEERLKGVGDTYQSLVADKTEVQKIRNAVTQWAIRTKQKVVTRTMKSDEGIVVTIELVENETTL